MTEKKQLSKQNLEIAGQLYRGQLDHLTGKQIFEMLKIAENREN